MFGLSAHKAGIKACKIFLVASKFSLFRGRKGYVGYVEATNGSKVEWRCMADDAERTVGEDGGKCERRNPCFLSWRRGSRDLLKG